MKINEKQLKELRNCELYQHMLPRYQKNVEWIIKEYIKLTEAENINTKIHFITKMEDGSIRIHSPLNADINQRRLLNLNILDFEFGLCPTSNAFMPFFGEEEIALFSGPRDVNEIENGDVCLIRLKGTDQFFLATKEQADFYDLECNYLCAQAQAKIHGTLVNIETK